MTIAWNDWQIEEISKGMAEAERGDFASDQDVEQTLRSGLSRRLNYDSISSSVPVILCHPQLFHKLNPPNRAREAGLHTLTLGQHFFFQWNA